jgi:hypothetical protein
MKTSEILVLQELRGQERTDLSASLGFQRMLWSAPSSLASAVHCCVRQDTRCMAPYGGTLLFPLSRLLMAWQTDFRLWHAPIRPVTLPFVASRANGVLIDWSRVFNRTSVWSVEQEKGAKKERRDRPKSGLTDHNHSVASCLTGDAAIITGNQRLGDSNHKHLKSQSPPAGATLLRLSREQFGSCTAPSDPQYPSRWIALHIFPDYRLSYSGASAPKGFLP